MKAPRLSFLDRAKAMMRATPTDLDPATKVVAWVLFSHAHDDGSSIYPSAETLCELAGMPRSSLFRHLKILADRGYLLDDGYKQHGRGCRTALRRLDLAALKRDRDAQDAAAGRSTASPEEGADDSPVDETLPLTPRPVRETILSPTHETHPRPTGGTQTDNQTREKETTEDTDSSLRSRRAGEPDLFEEFWEAYPRRVGKGAARKAYAAAAKRATTADILIGLRRQKWPSEARYIPNPTTWLNQDRWQDDPEAAAPSTRERGRLDWMLDEMLAKHAGAAGDDEHPTYDMDSFA